MYNRNERLFDITASSIKMAHVNLLTLSSVIYKTILLKNHSGCIHKYSEHDTKKACVSD